MVRTIIDLMNLGFSASSFFFSLIFFTIISIVLAKSIKKNANTYYWVFGTMGVLYALPILIEAMFDIEVPFTMSSIPVVNVIIREFSSASYFVHPILIIIMYMGALNLKTPYVAKLMSIRKELSIIVGFSVIAHATKRIIYTFPESWDYFVHHEAYVAEGEIVSILGATIGNFVLFLGIIMAALFLVLWVTSFDTVRLKMGAVKWKKVQKWSYVLYAMLFIHAMGLYVGGLVESHAEEKLELVRLAEAGESALVMDNSENAPVAENEDDEDDEFNLEDVELSWKADAYLNISLYVLIYGSYLYLRVRKSRRDKSRKTRSKN